MYINKRTYRGLTRYNTDSIPPPHSQEVRPLDTGFVGPDGPPPLLLLERGAMIYFGVPSYGVHVNGYVRDEVSPTNLAFTRCCFTLKLYCRSPSSFYCPPHLQSLPYSYTFARPLRNISPPTDPPFYAIHHNVLVMALSCKGQALTCDDTNLRRY